MRPDMAKIIVERPRPRSRIPRGRDGRLFRDASDAPFLPMKAGYRDTKSFNENLRPLARYLARQVNRPWDHVYREMRAVIDGRNTVQHHILQHLSQYVATHTRVVDGAIIDVGSQLFGVRRISQPLYVHPRTGILLRNPDDVSWKTHYRERLREADAGRAARWRELSAAVQLHRLEGEWFEVVIEDLPTAPETRWDAVRRRRVMRPARSSRHSAEDQLTAEIYERSGVYAVSKRQLSAREIRALGLRDGQR